MRPRVKKDAQERLARMAGQVTGIAKMLDDDRYCVDILTQVAALRAALENLGAIMLTEHIEDCVYGLGAPSDAQLSLTAEQRIEEVRVALSRFLK